MAFGSLEQHTDAVVGKNFRLQPEPNGHNLGWTAEQVNAFVTDVLNLWKVDAGSGEFFMDISGEKSFTQLITQHVRTFRIFGESFANLYERDLPERRPFRTAVGIIDPSRCTTPKKYQKDENVKAGIRRSGFGYPLLYYFSRKHPGSAQASNDDSFDAVPRRNELGRDLIIHSYLQDLPGLTRGVPAFAPALKRLCNLSEFQESTLDAAAWQATVAATLYSDRSDANETFTKLDESGNPVKYRADDYVMEQRGHWNKKQPLKYNNVDAKVLWNNERLEMNSPGQPIAQYAEFEHSMLKHFARALGTSVEWLTQDWSKTNFSGARAGLITTWRRIETDRANVAEQLANAVYSNWMEDCIANGRLSVPGFDDPTAAWLFFTNNRASMVCAKWFGPIKEEIDRAKTATFYKLLNDLGLLTLSQAAGELTDMTYQELIDQQVEEDRYRNKKIADTESDPDQAEQQPAEQGKSESSNEI
jgi:lambda family phage portal protein